MSRKASDERMSAEAFDALVELSSLSRGGRGTLALRAVVVDGASREEAARKYAVKQQTMRVLLMQQRRRLALARQAVG